MDDLKTSDAWRVQPPEFLKQPGCSWRTAALLLVVLTGLVGCQTRAAIDTTYGRRRGQGIRSVSGTVVLGNLFEQAGYRVSSWRRLSPKLEKEDVVVWFPDRFGVPYPEEIDYFENWLKDQPGRTLIYVGRDYDAPRDYWRRVLRQSSGIDRLRARQRLARSRSEHHARRQSEIGNAECRWFAFEFDVPAQRIDSLDGPLTGSVEPISADIASTSRLRLVDASGENEWQNTPTAEAILSGDGRVLAARLSRHNWIGSQVIVVADGSWLLNLAQVDHTNRRLADELIRRCGTPGRVCFLESGASRLAITDTDAELPIALRLFSVWPVNLFMLHLVVVGVLFCAHVWPIFGRPKRLPNDAISDFGKHVAAVGEMLERGHDLAYAKLQIKQYQELTTAKSSTEKTTD